MSSINLFIADDHTSTGFREATLDEIMTGARQALSARVRRGTLLNSPRLTANFLIARLGQRPYETFTLIYLDNRHRMIACEDLFRGTIDGASVHPREVVKEALRHNSAAVIFAHNHPSGVAEPSHADELITQRLKAALALVDIRVLDHRHRRCRRDHQLRATGAIMSPTLARQGAVSARLLGRHRTCRAMPLPTF